MKVQKPAIRQTSRNAKRRGPKFAMTAQEMENLPSPMKNIDFKAPKFLK